ncbi:MAG: CehA/McbA family metallohydrolase [Candidatus Bathyarchaeia archaeon]
MKLKIDLHVHTCYSYDALITPKDLFSYARLSGLDGVAVTDHNRIDGAIKLARESSFLIIPGIEVSSKGGHIIGLNIQEPIPKGLGVDETIDRIHKAGGIAIACHPGAILKSSLHKSVSKRFDAVEVINASALPFKRTVKRAQEIGKRLGLPQVGGSDAHYGPEIGSAYTTVEAEPDPESIVRAIKRGSCWAVGTAIPFGIRLKREVFSVKVRITGKKGLCPHLKGISYSPQQCYCRKRS